LGGNKKGAMGSWQNHLGRRKPVGERPGWLKARDRTVGSRQFAKPLRMNYIFGLMAHMSLVKIRKSFTDSYSGF